MRSAACSTTVVPPDVHGAEERYARLMAIGGDLFVAPAEEPRGREGLGRADGTLVLKPKYGVGLAPPGASRTRLAPPVGLV